MTVRKNTAGFFVAMALSLAVALGGFIVMDAGLASAASHDGVISAPALPDAETCTTTGWYHPGYYHPGGEIYVTTLSGVPVGPYPYWWGGPNQVPVVTTTTITVPPTAQLPYYGQAYLDPVSVNYACNAYDSCVPVSSGDAVVCPGNPAGITLNNASSAGCGSALNIDARVVGPTGMIVANGTPVLFSSTLGMTPATTSTNDGIASVSLSFPPRTQGTAVVTVTSGTARAETRITVTC